MTASAMAGDKQRCLEVGMDVYVSKPPQIKELCDRYLRLYKTTILGADGILGV
jgi:CheY-like chemotaxis protein